MPFGPWPGSGGGAHVDPDTLPKFQLALSYGEGADGNDDLAAGESFWFQPQSVNLSPLADQVHEWPTAREITFIGLTVWIDAAEINVVTDGDPPRFIVTVDGADTIFQLVLAAGSHADEPLQINGAVAIAPLSRIGVRFDGADLDAASTLRCEMILDGATTGEPIPPPPIPTAGLILDLASENYVATDAGGGSTGAWSDQSGNGNDLNTGGTLFLHVPAKVADVFSNHHPGVVYDRATSFGMTKVGPTWYAGNAARTHAMVVKGGNISLGTLLHRRATAGNSYDLQLSGVSAPQIVWINNAGNIQTTGDFVDLNGQKAILLWWTAGGIGDPLFFQINALEQGLDATMAAEGAATNFIELGYDEGVYGDSQRAACTFGRVLAWNRVLTLTERIGLLSNLTAEYLS